MPVAASCEKSPKHLSTDLSFDLSSPRSKNAVTKVVMLRGIVNILKTIFAHAFRQKDLATITGFGGEKAFISFQKAILRETHNIHIGAPKLRDITNLFHHILFSMKRGCRETRATTTSPVAIAGGGDDLAALDKDRQMNLVAIGVAKTGRPRILHEPLKNPLLSCVKLLEHR